MTITEISRKYNIPPETLRYYERIGMIPRVTRNKNNIRDYAEQDCRWVEFVKGLRTAGVPVEVLIDYVGLYQQGDVTIEARRELFIEQRDRLLTQMEELQKTLECLDYKIAAYGKTMNEEKN